ncbi:MAG: TIM-barrel domain-containing protein, partial [Cyclobacteriaceae bacterium]
DKEVLNVARTFREKNIPADVIVLDIHYMDAYKIFSWDSENFPDPKGMMDQLKEMGFEVVVMCDPGIKVEEGYEPYDDGCDHDVFVKYPDGTNYTGEVWPGWCHFPDFTNPKTRQWWGEKFADYAALGIEGYWNDMNEIATWGQRLPDLLEFDFEGEKATSKQGRNVYGMQMSRSTFDGAKKQLQGKRPFILTRSGFSGVQRYSAVWTGDNVSNDEHMLLGVRIVNSLGLTGVAFTGYDVGGFVGESSGNLFARWISIGALSPFFRGHSMINSSDAEPWAYGEEVEEISRHYIDLRYRLLPYIYSLFYEASQTGMPVSRSLAIDHPFDENVFDTRFQNQYLFGPTILVVPTESYRDLTKVYLPAGEWHDFHTGKKHKGSQTIVAESPLNQLPIFIRGGCILPMQSVVQSASSQTDSVLQLHLYAGSEGSTFEYYEDDGSTYAYQQGDTYKRQLQFSPKNQQITLGAVEGTAISKFSKAKVFLHGFAPVSQVKINDDPTSVEAESIIFIPPVSNFDPIDNEVKVEGLPVQSFVFALKNDEIVIQY